MKKMISILLALVMMLTAIPVQNIWATELEEIQTVEVEGETITFEDDSVTNDELFAGYVESLLYPENGVSMWAVRSAGDKLSGANLAIYTKLKGKIKETASGDETSTIYTVAVDELGLEKTSWTAEELGMETLIENNTVSDAAANAVYEELNINMPVVFDALLADCPYELYWFDKTASTSWSTYAVGAEYDETGTIRVYPLGEMSVKFCVSSDYAKSTYVIDTDKIDRVNTAIANASSIVEANSEKSDFEKLNAYRQEICDFVSYNDSAADDDTTPYGDPWQLISVFDGDTETNVVCEGYSKAFQYLCDLTSFANEQVKAISVSGVMATTDSSGGHMWNIVSMEDGINYLVDVTNCDEGTIGADTQLFLAGAYSGSVDDGYTYECVSKNVVYAYDSDTIALFETEELQMSSEDYVSVTHNWDEGEVTTAPTCTDSGVRTYFCIDADCGETRTEAIPATGHSWDAGKESKEATCAAEGEMTYTCTVCGDTRIETIAKKAHEWNEETTIDKEATCTEAGEESIHCGKCNTKKEESIEAIPATGHSWDAGKESKEATCLAEGEMLYTCTVCGDTRIETIAKKAHEWNEETTIDKEATCTEAGEESIHCGKCNTKKEESIEAIPATGHSWDAGKENKEATCAAEGEMTYTCTVCGDTRIETIGTTAHVWNEETTIDKEATCLEVGQKSNHCGICNTINEETVVQIPIADHRWKEEATVDKAATCFATGQKSIHCSVCDTVDEDTIEIIPMAAHSWNGGIITKAATCEASGERTYTCTACGETDKKTISQTGHKWETTLTIDKAPTCTATGQQSIHCSVCNKVKSGTETTIPAKGHSGEWKVKSQATVFSPQIQQRTCNVNVCKTVETKSVGKKVEPVLELPGNLTKLSIKKGKSATFTVTMEAGDYLISCESSNKNVKVDYAKSTGKIKITGKKKGKAILTIALKGYGERTYEVNVTTKTIKTSAIAIPDTKVTLKKGKTYKINATVMPFTSTEKVTYKSSNKKVATVSSAGKITAKGPGTATITVKSGSKKKTIKVTVIGITGVSNSLTIKKGKTKTLKPKKYGISETFTFISSKTSVATISETGKIKAKKKGKTTITIIAGTYKVTCKVTVK